ncbi:MAG: helix-turn-helix domain-containing protein [Pirellulaceae bacterium]
MNTETNESVIVIPTAEETELARSSNRRLAKILGDNREKIGLRIEHDGGGESIDVPPVVIELLNYILTELGEGNAVSVIPVAAELTTRQAAEVLRVSQAFLAEQMENGTIPFRDEQSQRRILLKDIIAYTRSTNEKRLEALDELAAEAQDLKLGY